MRKLRILKIETNQKNEENDEDADRDEEKKGFLLPFLCSQSKIKNAVSLN